MSLPASLQPRLRTSRTAASLRISGRTAIFAAVQGLSSSGSRYSMMPLGSSFRSQSPGAAGSLSISTLGFAAVETLVVDIQAVGSSRTNRCRRRSAEHPMYPQGVIPGSQNRHKIACGHRRSPRYWVSIRGPNGETKSAAPLATPLRADEDGRDSACCRRATEALVIRSHRISFARWTARLSLRHAHHLPHYLGVGPTPLRGRPATVHRRSGPLPLGSSSAY